MNNSNENQPSKNEIITQEKEKMNSMWNELLHLLLERVEKLINKGAVDLKDLHKESYLFVKCILSWFPYDSCIPLTDEGCELAKYLRRF